MMSQKQAQMEVDRMELEVNITPRHQRRKPHVTPQSNLLSHLSAGNIDSNTPSPRARNY